MFIVLTHKLLVLGVSSIQEMCYDTSTIELNESNIEQLKDNGLISHKFDVLPLDYKSK